MSISKQYALKSLGGSMATGNSFSKVMTPIVILFFENLQVGGEGEEFADSWDGLENETSGGAIYRMS